MLIKHYIYQEKIIGLISDNPYITQAELAKEVGITVDGIKYHIRKLSKNGVIKRVGADKGGHWVVMDSNDN